VLIRTWNLFHGNSKPPQRGDFLEEMLALAVTGDPDVVCLQELPAWALPHLDDWTGYTAVTAIAARPTLGPFPSTPELGRAITSLNHGLLRSAFAGQGNAILLSPRLRARDEHVCTLNPWSFRRRQARWLGLGPLARIAWAKERRVCIAVRVEMEARTIVVANLHATSYPPDERLADAELLRAFVFVDGIAEPDEPIVVAGDFNVVYERSRTLHDVAAADWGFSKPGTGIDHVLVRGADTAAGPRRWPLERRERHGVLLSDHAPVDLELAW
jgi:endonuclease/exonuclease/phosphatase family metal-dependent hydrolase